MIVTEDEIKAQVKLFQKRLRELMDDAGLNSYELAKAAGVTQKKIDLILTRDSFPEIESLIPICIVLGVKLRDLFSYDAEKKVDYTLQITPKDIALLEIRHGLTSGKRACLQAYAEGLRDG